jgi:hypothetical protein
MLGKFDIYMQKNETKHVSLSSYKTTPNGLKTLNKTVNYATSRHMRKHRRNALGRYISQAVF